MKHLLLLVNLVFASYFVFGQCSEVFISEYVEGTFNNKALELYNPTDQAIDLKDYRLVRWSNGNFIYDPLYKVDISGIIPPLGVYVLVVDKRDPQGTGNEQPVDNALQAKADTFLCPVYNVNRTLYHNGNDAYTLEKRISGTWTVIDVFAEVGVDPGQSWTDNANASPPFTDGPGGTWWTRNRVLIRRADKVQGLTTTLQPVTGAAAAHPTLEDSPSPFDPRVEWDTLNRDWIYDTTASPYVDSLGTHNCVCKNMTAIREVYTQITVRAYPNPANGDQITISSDVRLTEIIIRDILGNSVREIQLEKPSSYNLINIEDLSSGIYLFEIFGEKKGKTVEKVIIP